MKLVYLVTCFENPDLDGFACTLAYAALLRQKGLNAVPFISGTPHIEADYLMRRFGLKYPSKIADSSKVDKIILVDASNVNGLAHIDLNKVIEVIDHHESSQKDNFPNAKIDIQLVGAAATLIAEHYKEANVNPSKETAVLLYGAIVSNTLNFQANVTTERDRQIAEWLKQIAHLPENLAQEMFAAKSNFTESSLRQVIQNDFAWFEINNVRFGIVQLEVIQGKEFAAEWQNLIRKEMDVLKTKLNLDFIFASIISLDQRCNIFIAQEPKVRNMLAGSLNIDFKNDIALRSGLIMRKEIVPVILKGI